MSELSKWCSAYTIVFTVIVLLGWAIGHRMQSLGIFIISFNVACLFMAFRKVPANSQAPRQPPPGVYDPIQHARNLGEL